MQATIAGGVFRQQQPSQLLCTTGNCTFDTGTTLGVCAGCRDIPGPYEVLCSDILGGYSCDYTLLDGVHLQAQAVRWFDDLVQTRWNSTLSQPSNNFSTLPINAKDRRATLTRLQAIQLPQTISDKEDPDVKGKLSLAKAFECQFSFCVKTYPQFNITHGEMWLPVPQEDYLINDQVHYSITKNMNVTVFDTMVRNSSFTKGTDSTKYKLNPFDRSTLSLYLARMFDIGWYADGIATGRKADPDNYRGEPYISAAMNAGRELANSPNLDATVKAIAEGMTEAIRTSRNGTKVFGKAYETKTMIKIRWAWMAYPIVLTLISTVLLISMILRTRGKGTRIWKNSSLALLIHSLQDWEPPEDGYEGRKDLKAGMGTVRARIQDHPTHPAFIKED